MDENLLRYIGWQGDSFSTLSQFKPNLTTGAQKFDFKSLMPMTPKQVPKEGMFKQAGSWLKKDAAKTDIFGQGNGIMQGIGSLNGMIPSNPETSNSLTQGLNTGYDLAADTLSKIPGIGSVIGGGMKVMGAVSDGLNAITNGRTTIENASNTADKIMSSKFLSLTPIGLANSLGKKTLDGSNEDLVKSVNMGYNPTEGLGKTDIGGITQGFSKLFGKDLVKGRQKNVNYINTQNAGKSSAIYQQKRNMLASNNSISDIANRNRNKVMGGINTNILSAKQGTKIEPLTKNLNVIPSGALHARKNNLPEEIAKDVTHKGIPVVSEKQGGGLKQHAEIEHSEIIFTKQVTQELEKMLKEFNDGNENVVLEAGKLLTHEILENTNDNIGLLNNIK